MTEHDWLRSQNPARMLREGAGPLSVRKLLLVGCGCYRLAWDTIPLVELREVIEEAERAADGESTPEENRRVWETANRARNLSTATMPGFPLEYKSVNGKAASWAAYSMNAAAGMDEVTYIHPEIVDVVEYLTPVNRTPSVNRRQQAEIVRCVVGNPFRSVAIDPTWRTKTVVALASAVYADHAFDRLPILADALEEAGCSNSDVLAHCRSPGPHARGCWVVDGVLGKS